MASAAFPPTAYASALRWERQDAHINNSQPLGTIDLEIRSDHAALVLGQHGRRATRVHKRKVDGVFDIPDQLGIALHSEAGRCLDSSVLLHRGGGDHAP